MRIKISDEEYKILCNVLATAKLNNDEHYFEYWRLLDKLSAAKKYSESNKTPRGVLRCKELQQVTKK